MAYDASDRRTDGEQSAEQERRWDEVLRDVGVSVRDHRAVLTQNDIRTIRVAHDQGASARELGRRCGLAHTTILRHLS